MISLGFGTVTEELEARIQARVGDFLSAKAKLLTMQRSSLVNIRDEAIELYGKQVALEKDLSSTMALIEKIKTGAYTMSDVVQVGWFAAMLEKHVRDVEDLEKEYKGVVPAEAGIVAPPLSTIAILVGIGLVAYIWISKRR